MKYKSIKKEGQVFVRDTDATGRVFCPRPIEWVIEAFEQECYRAAYSEEKVAIVKASVNFLHPFAWFDPYILELKITRIGNRSFDLVSLIHKGAATAIEVEITFVVAGASSQSFLDRFWPGVRCEEAE